MRQISPIIFGYKINSNTVYFRNCCHLSKTVLKHRKYKEDYECLLSSILLGYDKKFLDNDRNQNLQSELMIISQ